MNRKFCRETLEKKKIPMWPEGSERITLWLILAISVVRMEDRRN